MHIGEKPSQFTIMLVEPRLYRPFTDYLEQNFSPDIIIGYFNGNHSVLELKNSWGRERKAVRQITNGIEWLVEMYNVDPQVIVGKMVVRSDKTYDWKLTHQNGVRCNSSIVTRTD